MVVTSDAYHDLLYREKTTKRADAGGSNCFPTTPPTIETFPPELRKKTNSGRFKELSVRKQDTLKRLLSSKAACTARPNSHGLLTMQYVWTMWTPGITISKKIVAVCLLK